MILKNAKRVWSWIITVSNVIWHRTLIDIKLSEVLNEDNTDIVSKQGNLYINKWQQNNLIKSYYSDLCLFLLDWIGLVVKHAILLTKSYSILVDIN